MRIIFTRKISEHAFVMQEKQGWFADRHYSVVTTSEPYPTSSSSNSPTHTPQPTSTPHSSPHAIPNPQIQNEAHVRIVEPPPNSTPYATTNSTTSHPATNFTSPHPAINSPAPTPAKRRMSIFRTAPKENNSTLCPALIVYYHGGGFIAMTSFSHEMYTRKWAVDTSKCVSVCVGVYERGGVSSERVSVLDVPILELITAWHYSISSFPFSPFFRRFPFLVPLFP
jgi:hypothetical protein